MTGYHLYTDNPYYYLKKHHENMSIHIKEVSHTFTKRKVLMFSHKMAQHMTRA